MAIIVWVMFCPVCDDKHIQKSEVSPEDALQMTIDHVARAHPLYDPDWYDKDDLVKT